ncbi:MAG: TlpA family protein disulfide reductase [Deltaproteobacteria bacterium]|nr:TlpA family protein disulfide reductase [Deltaproteobacteria bacterium]
MSRKRSSKKAPEEAASPSSAEPGGPSSLLKATLVLATFGAAAYFTSVGFADASVGRGRLAGKLLKVEARNQNPLPFTLESMSGGKVALSDFAGKVIFLNFWATWCPPCLEEMPSMRRLESRLRGKNIVMLAVSADESWDPVKKMFETDPPPFKVLLDPSGELAKQYGTTMFPETYVIKDGRIIGFIEGPRDWDDWFADVYLDAVVPPS